MINPDGLCMGCMKQKGMKERCPYCGFSLQEYMKKQSGKALLPGTILKGIYLLGKIMGEGGFGITYIALNLNTEEPVAVKEYFPVNLAARDTMTADRQAVSLPGGNNRQLYEDGLKNFSAEAKRLRQFSSLPGITGFIDFFCENRTGYLVMEYINGTTLGCYLNRKKYIPEKETLVLMRPVLNTLAQLHRHGVIHRDISPDNIMVRNNGQLYLIDLGAARHVSEAEDQSITVLLKRGYAPVEQYQTHGRQGPWTDIYAVCAVMYKMISGRVPHESIDRMIGKELPDLEDLSLANGIPSVSHRTSQSIKKGLSVRSADRYQTAEEFMEALYDETADIQEDTQDKEERKQQTVLITILLPLVLFLLTASVFLSLNSGDTDRNQLPAEQSGTAAAAREPEPAAAVSGEGTICEIPISDIDFSSCDELAASVSRMTDKKVYAVFDKAYDIRYLTVRCGRNDYSAGSGRERLEVTLGDTVFDIPLSSPYEETCLKLEPPVRCSVLCLEASDSVVKSTEQDIYIEDAEAYGIWILE